MKLTYAPLPVLEELGIKYEIALPFKFYMYLMRIFRYQAPGYHVAWIYPEGHPDGMPWPLTKAGEMAVRGWTLRHGGENPVIEFDVSNLAVHAKFFYEEEEEEELE